MKKELRPFQVELKNSEILILKFRKIRHEAFKRGIDEKRFKSLCIESRKNRYFMRSIGLLLTAVILGIANFTNNKCAFENNFFVMEISRPKTNCSICSHLDRVIVFNNLTSTKFAQIAYTSRPFLVQDGTGNWSALNSFSFAFFKDLYDRIPSAYDSIDDECQFFPFKTDFLNLKNVFQMDTNRAELKGEPWYVGWSNCNPEVAAVLRNHYQRPRFLPEDSERSAIDWIFMGGSGQGASLHLDYVHRPSWQAQIRGKKTWHLVPPPECEEICRKLEVVVNPGDILFVDTNQWYHDTVIHPGDISITIGSEYD